MNRRTLARRFGARRLEPLAPDASVRSFARIFNARGGTAIVMVDPHGGSAALDRLFEAYQLLRSIGIPVPLVLDRDDRLSAILFEDLGDTLLADALPQLSGEQRARAYHAAGAIAARIAHAGTALLPQYAQLTTPQLGAQRLAFEMNFFVEHDVIGRRAISDDGLIAALRAELDRLVEKIAGLPRQLAHRDFHARNLMWRDTLGLGVVDFQDTLEAPPLYDFASLVRDPYVDPDDSLAAAAAAGYQQEVAGEGDPRAEPAFGLVALQRDLKAIGTYAFQATRLGRTRFLTAIPIAQRLALRALEEVPATVHGELVTLLQRIGF